jgi:predicted dehydrogenase
MTSQPVRVALIGVGGMARHHIRRMLRQQDTTKITALCEPSPLMQELAAQEFRDAGLEPPPFVSDTAELLAKHVDNLDAVFIITPHAQHHDQAKACMEAGLDVLLEKPMVINAGEAHSLIETRDRTGRLLVIAFQSSLSPQIRTAAKMLRSGELGQILNIAGSVWQNWNELNGNTWRTDPVQSGGGFLFDTGAHMLNTVADLAGENFLEVAAFMDNRGRQVDILSAVIGRLESGAMVTISACGDTIPSCASDVRVFCTKAILRTGVWGERLEVQRFGRKHLRAVPVPEWIGVWEQFLAVRNGEIENPSPPEIGLRMTRLWDAIKASAAQGGALVQCERDMELEKA